MQNLTHYTELLTLGDSFTKQGASAIYQYIMEAVHFAQAAKCHGINVINIFTGTYPIMSAGIFTAVLVSVGLKEISADEFLEGDFIDAQWWGKTLSLTLADAKKMRKYNAEKDHYSVILLKDSCIQFKVKYFNFRPTQAEVLSTFAAEQKKAVIRSGNLKNHSLKDLFVYVTNCQMTLTEEVKAVQHICSAIMPANCFEKVFGPAFDLMRPFAMAELQAQSSETQNKAKPYRRNNKRKQDEMEDKFDDSVESPKKKAKK